MNTLTDHNLATLAILRRSWALMAISWGVVLVLGYLFLRGNWPYANQWALVASVVLLFSLWTACQSLPDNHRRGEERLLPTLGLANMLTLSRGLVMGLLAGFLFAPWPEGGLAWAPAILYSLVVLADHFDGYLARMMNQVTVFGGKLDVEFDSLAILIIVGIGIGYERLPWWYLIIGLARYLFLFGMWCRTQFDWPVYELSSSVHRRVIATFQMGFLMIALWPILPTAPVRLAGIAYGIPMLVGFLRDWLIVIGRFDPQSATYRQAQRWSFIALAKWLPLLLRLVVVVVMFMIYSRGNLPQAWIDFLSASSFPWPILLAYFIALIAILTTIAIALGIVARTPSILALLPIGLDILIYDLNWYNGLALWSLSWITILGTGYFSLWQPEESTILLDHE